MPKHPLEKMKSKEIKNLLRLEKERRGIDTDKLVFIGVADLAQYWWCAAEIRYYSRKEIRKSAPTWKCAARSLIESADDCLFYSDLIEKLKRGESHNLLWE